MPTPRDMPADVVRDERGRTNARLSMVLGAYFLLRLVLAVVIPLFPDEAYYWDWSRQLAAGYFDHPPGIALLIRFGTALLGYTPLGVRFGSVVLGTVATTIIVVLAHRLGGRRAALVAAVTLVCVPIAEVGFLLATPDAPLIIASALTFLALDIAISQPVGSGAALGAWCAAGVALGLGLVSKYTAVLLPFGVLVACVVHSELRAQLRTIGPYVAGVLALSLFAPVVVWNAHHDWISFAFQLHHGLGAPRGSALSREAAMMGGQVGLATPVLFVLLVLAVVRAVRGQWETRIGHVRPRAFLLATIAITMFVFFMVSALRRPVEANWPAPALFPAIVLLAAWVAEGSQRLWRWWVAGCVIGAACVVVLTAQALVPILPIAPRKDPIARAHGWNDLAHAVDSTAMTMRVRCDSIVVAANRYQDAAEIAFYSSRHPFTTSLNVHGRTNQYAVWPGYRARVPSGGCMLLVLDDNPVGEGIAASLASEFAAVTRGVSVELRRGSGVVARRRVWVLRGKT